MFHISSMCVQRYREVQAGQVERALTHYICIENKKQTKKKNKAKLALS